MSRYVIYDTELGDILQEGEVDDMHLEAQLLWPVSPGVTAPREGAAIMVIPEDPDFDPYVGLVWNPETKELSVAEAG